VKPKKQKVFVGLSGGVDSTVAALLLQQAGYEVVGVFIKVWQPDFIECTWREERRSAMRAAAHLNIPFYTLDLSREYKQGVVDYMVAEYGAGRIPNPDVMCNKYIKFGAFLDFARANGGDMIATGHYAQIVHDDDGTPTLHEAKDKTKDQSYFLWTIDEAILSQTLFPIGNIEKSEVRKIAKKYTLPNAEKKDSQGLCFMGLIDMPTFLEHFLHTEKGPVKGLDGKIIGEHDGAVLYAIGQRHGFRVERTSAEDLPYYVISKDIASNTLVVGNQEKEGKVHPISEFILDSLHTVSSSDELPPRNLSVRIRYHGLKIPCVLSGNSVRLDTPQDGISEGQSAVFYHENQLVGGGIIAKTCESA